MCIKLLLATEMGIYSKDNILCLKENLNVSSIIISVTSVVEFSGRESTGSIF